MESLKTIALATLQLKFSSKTFTQSLGKHQQNVSSWSSKKLINMFHADHLDKAMKEIYWEQSMDIKNIT